MIPPTSRLRIDVVPEDPRAVLDGLREGLTRTPREISPRFFYDDVGSRLFEEITELPEYYPTRTEAIIRSMTANERLSPQILDGSRRRRIARGSGTSVQDVNELLRQFKQARKMMKMFSGGGPKPSLKSLARNFKR